MEICKRRSSYDSNKSLYSASAVPSAAGNLTVTFSSQLNQHNQVTTSAGGQKLYPCTRRTSCFIRGENCCHHRFCSEFLFQVPSAGGAVPLLNYQPALYQQATINIPGLTQQSVPIPTRPTGLCSQTEPFQQTLIVCPPSTIQGENCRLTKEMMKMLLSNLRTIWKNVNSVFDMSVSSLCGIKLSGF